MKWFKHDSTASMDAKLKKLRLRYGLEGYGLYWYLLECIARTVEPHNLTYELEEDSELLAAELNVNREQIEEMMLFMVDLSLFEHTDGIVTCLKLRERSDEYTNKLLKTAKLVGTNSGVTPDKVRSNRIEKNRTEEKRTEKKPPSRKQSRFTPPLRQEVADFLDQENLYYVDINEFFNHYESNGWMVAKNKMKCWKATCRQWQLRRKKEMDAAKKNRGRSV